MTQVKSFAGMGEAQLKQLFAGMFTVTSSPLTAHTGVLGSSGLTVRQTTTASASVTVDSGVALSMGSALAGVTPLVSDQVETLDVLDANPLGGVPRNDIVVFDPGTVVAGSGGLRVIMGDPNAVPTDPTVPSTAVPLARLRLDPGVSATTVPNSQIDDLRPFTSMRGGVVQARNTDERGAFDQDATFVYRSDAKVLEVYDGTRWRTHGQVSDAKAGKRAHWGTASITTDASGIATVTHGAGFTPSVVDPSRKGITGSLWRVDQSDNYTSTTFDVRVVDGTGGTAPNGTALTIQFFCGE